MPDRNTTLADDLFGNATERLAKQLDEHIMAKKVIIAGGRDLTDFDYLENRCIEITLFSEIIEIVSGGAKGADALGQRLAEEWGIPLIKFPADWDTHGKKAGYLRNEQMAQYADVLVAFWDGKSKGDQTHD